MGGFDTPGEIYSNWDWNRIGWSYRLLKEREYDRMVINAAYHGIDLTKDGKSQKKSTSKKSSSDVDYYVGEDGKTRVHPDLRKLANLQMKGMTNIGVI